ncbi:hypothetical protein F5051DRAFT_446559 [Lentinula edodes]|nr:hypothetical protein F5051DRAFT_446559 [Lentinula edodes]
MLLLVHSLYSIVVLCSSWVHTVLADASPRPIPDVISHAVGSIPNQFFEAVASKYEFTQVPVSLRNDPPSVRSMKDRLFPVAPFTTDASVATPTTAEAEDSSWTTITIEHRSTTI